MWLLLCVSYCSIAIADGLFTLLSPGGDYLVHKGTTIHLQCQFHMASFSYYENSIVWTKRQFNDTLNINTHSTILHPFDVTGRFKVSFFQRVNKMGYTLTITDISKEDEGDYYCRIFSSSKRTLGIVHYNVATREAVQRVSMTLGNMSDMAEKNLKSLTVIESEPVDLNCVVTGGHPMPRVDLFLNDFNITNEFESNTSCVFVHNPGLSAYECNSVWSTEGFAPSAKHDESTLKCTAYVDGLAPVETSMQLVIHYPPLIKCTSTRAVLGDFNAQIKCQIQSKPRLTSVHWILHSEGRTLHRGQVTKNSWITVVDKSDYSIETALHFDEVEEKSFGSYVIVASNKIGASNEIAYLYKDSYDIGATFEPSVGVKALSSSSFHPSPSHSIFHVIISTIVIHYVNF